MTKPEANRPLTGDDVKLLKAGDVLRRADGTEVTFRCECTEPGHLYLNEGLFWPQRVEAFAFVSRPTHPEPERDGAVERIDDEWRELFGSGPDSFANPGVIHYDEFKTACLSLLSTAERQRDEDRALLTDLLADYKALADSGDAGNWRLEETDIGKRVVAHLHSQVNP